MSRQRNIRRNMEKRAGEIIPVRKRKKTVGTLQSEINKKAADYVAGKSCYPTARFSREIFSKEEGANE